MVCKPFYQELLERKGAFSEFIAEQERRDDEDSPQPELDTEEAGDTFQPKGGVEVRRRIKTESLGSLSEAGSSELKYARLETSSTCTEYKSITGRRTWIISCN